MAPERDPDPYTSLREIVAGEMFEIRTLLPAKVERYQHDPPMVDVLPLFKRFYLDDDDQEIEVPPAVITNVPIEFPRGGGFAISWPLKKGDPVWLHVAERSIDRYMETDGKTPVDPADARRFDLTDAVCYPGGGTARNAIANAHPDHLVIGLEDGSGELHIKPDGTFRFGDATASKALAIAETTNSRLQALETAVTMPHGSTFGPTVPPPFFPGAGGASTASGRTFTDG